MARTYTLPTENPNPVRRGTGMGTEIAHSTGGAPFQGRVLDRPGWQGVYDGATTDRAPGNTNDTLIQRTRDYLWREAYYIPPALGPGNLSWTDAGPIRDMPTTRFNRNLRPLVGGSNQQYEGMHTYLETGGQAGYSLPGKKKMKSGRQNRLTVQRYRGQSYSATTVVNR